MCIRDSMISDQIALHSVQITIIIFRVSYVRICMCSLWLPCFKTSLSSSRAYCFVFLLSFSLLSVWWNTQMEVKMKCSWITLWTRPKLSGSEPALPSTEWQKCLQSRTSSSSSSSHFLVPFVPRHLRFIEQWKKISDKVRRFSWTFS